MNVRLALTALMPPPSLGGGVAVGRTSWYLRSDVFEPLRCSVLLLSPKACSWSIVYSQLVFRKQTISACHRHTTDHKCSNMIHHEGTCVHPDEFLRSRVTGQSTSGSALPSSVSSPTVKVFGFVTNQTNRKYR